MEQQRQEKKEGARAVETEEGERRTELGVKLMCEHALRPAKIVRGAQTRGLGRLLLRRTNDQFFFWCLSALHVNVHSQRKRMAGPQRSILTSDQCAWIASEMPRTMVIDSAFSFSGLLRVNHATVPVEPLRSRVISCDRRGQQLFQAGLPTAEALSTSALLAGI